MDPTERASGSQSQLSDGAHRRNTFTRIRLPGSSRWSRSPRSTRRPREVSGGSSSSHWTRFLEIDQVVVGLFCREMPGACVHTLQASGRGRRLTQDRLLLVVPVASLVPDWIARLLLECRNLEIEIRQVLGPPASSTCTEMLFGLVVQLLRQADAYARTDSPASASTTKRDQSDGQLAADPPPEAIHRAIQGANRKLATDGTQPLARCSLVRVFGSRTAGCHGFDMRLVMIGDHLVGLLASSAQRSFEERQSRRTVTVLAEEYVESLPVLIKRPCTSSAFRSCVRRRPRPHTICHLVVGGACGLRQRVAVQRLDPAQHRSPGHVEAALGQQLQRRLRRTAISSTSAGQR
jgi:hypothetical protein